MDEKTQQSSAFYADGHFISVPNEQWIHFLNWIHAMKTKLPRKMQRLGPLSGSWAQSCLVLRQFLARQLLKLPLIWKWKHQKIAK